MLDKIKICGEEYKIQLGDEIREDGFLGKIYLAKNLIIISKELSEDQQKKVLLHEIMHACFCNSGLQHAQLTEELVVDALSSQLFGVLKDNKLI